MIAQPSGLVKLVPAAYWRWALRRVSLPRFAGLRPALLNAPAGRLMEAGLVATVTQLAADYSEY